MKLKLDRIISIATLAASLTAIVLVLKRPAPVAQPQTTTAAIAARAPSSSPPANPPEPAAKPARQTQPSQAGSPSSAGSSIAPQASQIAQAPQTPKLEAPINSDEISAAISQALGASATGAAGLSPDSDIGSAMPNIKDQKVTYDGDMVLSLIHI